MTVRRFGLSAILGLVLTGLLGVSSAQAYHTNFQGSCTGIGTNVTTKMKRTQARSYALVGKDEGYQFGGGCWNNNNVDDAPGDPHGSTTTRGEGGDCSGFTYKSWYLRPDTTQSGWRIHDSMENTHGPLQAWEFHDGAGAAVFNIAKADAIFMDAFASSYHVGMIYTANVALNADDMIEAKGEDVGTKVLRQTYRGTTDYAGVRRTGWQVECYPQCAGND
jgi:hypothetical protein